MVSGQCPDAREGNASLEASSELGLELFPWVVPELLLVQNNTRLLLKVQSLGSGARGTGLSFPTQRISLPAGSLLEGAKRLSPKRCVSRPTLKPGCSESRIEEGSHSSIFSVLQSCKVTEATTFLRAVQTTLHTTTYPLEAHTFAHRNRPLLLGRAGGVSGLPTAGRSHPRALREAAPSHGRFHAVPRRGWASIPS